MLWDSAYVTGDVTVDGEHMEIFSMVERLLNDDFGDRLEKIMTSINFLADYVARHFTHEEELMEKSGYRQAGLHKSQHRDFAQTVGQLVKKLQTNPESVDLSLEINQVIVGWLTGHVMSSDKQLIDHYRAWAGEAVQIT